MFIKIAKIGTDKTVTLAAKELKKYLGKMDKDADIAILSYKAYDKKLDGVLWVGMDDAFTLPAVTDKKLDDGIAIDVKDCVGYISGTNERAVLIAVYRFLRELGCAFLRPGADGEIIPEKSVAECAVKVCEAASYRHRAICIEGTVSYDDVDGIIDWMPKVGMNGFYNQFRIPFTFYERWYMHKGNEKNYTPFKLTPEVAAGMTEMSVEAIKERGLMYHAIGHGWTCEPFGINALGWYTIDKELDPEITKNFALIDGKREAWHGVPMNTNLCYSSENVQDIISSAVADYSAEHPEIDYIHVWLADGTNNHCECDECKKMSPSDYYVRLLNNIDKKMTAAGSDAKVVFLIYVDLLWAPEIERLVNPDRFVLMFAPITRTYSNSMAEDTEFDGVLPEYNRNKNKMPASVSENIAHLRNWQKDFKCDSFDFDYHYMWDHFKDIGNIQLAKVLFDDMANLDKIGLNGMVSCQCIRSFFPHGLGMNAMAAALWDKNADFEKTAREYFGAAFGKDGDKVYEFMTALSTLTDPSFMRAEYENPVSPALVASLDKALKLTDEFKSVIDKNITNENETVALSYKYLYHHNEFAKLYIELEKTLASGDIENAQTACDTLKEYAKNNERELHRVFDVYVFSSTIQKKCFDKIISKINKARA